MLTRSRFGVYANENAAVGVKDSFVQKAKIMGVSTRSRTALGDIKNKATSMLVKDIGKPKSVKDEQFSEQKMDKRLDMSIDGLTPDVPTQTYPHKLKEFQACRRIVRMDCLASQLAEEFLDVDRNDYGDAATVYPYSERIFNYLQDRELLVQPLVADYMAPNCEITPRMRYILINWLVQVHYSYKLQPETLYLCVAILDRYLLKNSKSLTKDGFQLIGVASLFIAAKFEEMYPPDISDFSSITNNTYSKSDIRNTEQVILQSIDFYLSIPTPLVFLRRLSKAVDADRTMHNLAKYFLELTVQEYDLAHLPGNLRSVTALCLSRALCLGTSELERAWCNKLSYLSGYVLDDIRDYLQILARAAYRQNSPSKYRAIFNKYRMDDFYGRVASLPQLRSYLMETLADLKFDSDGEANPA
ncbi:G2/mitotic-specific cyclin-B2 isoform 2 [Schistosoma japonicum]|uniref:G2/mitotic-specific cyclin-B2 isoform 2 n=1 Tax=Schistosoma japonicum TaxID=6182 RepID=Q5D8P0_SCHJA|nr:SJCHGC02339 protein [Schistosoma japonicum]KAH8877591.1 G2/mitotic-specific cyclin-B2 [Schistosoma japonicum]TNN07081.1 G2/mitotic-specific cyclin-B2 isoform 2 [Schistosoma japonicum]